MPRQRLLLCWILLSAVAFPGACERSAGEPTRCSSSADCNDQDPCTLDHCDSLSVCHYTLICYSDENCTNGTDDDEDLLVDCQDPDCYLAPGCCFPTSELCSDDQDNDCDGLVDCDDPDCSQVSECCEPVAEDCTDWQDNDCDHLVDCLDPDCRDHAACTCPPERCGSGLDDDCDSVTDCEDPDCAGSVVCGGDACTVPPNSYACSLWLGSDALLGETNVERYSCGGPLEPGLEMIHAFQGSAAIWGDRPLQVTVRLTPVDVNLDLFVLEASDIDPELVCDPGQCLVHSAKLGTEIDEVTFIAQADRTYYLVVDSPTLDASTQHGYTLTTDCAQLCEVEDCSDGLDNDCDGWADCLDPDCQAEPGC